MARTDRFRTLLAAAICTAAASAAPAGQIERPYSHPGAGFTLMAPGGWVLNDHAPPADLQMTPVVGEGLMEITATPTSVGLEPVSYAAGWESSALGRGKLFHRKQAGHPLQLGTDRVPAYAGVYEGDGVLVKVLFVSTGDRLFVLMGVFRTADFARGEAIFDRMALSFRAQVPTE